MGRATAWNDIWRDGIRVDGVRDEEERDMGGMMFNLRGRGVECQEWGIEGLANDIQRKIDRNKLIQKRSSGMRDRETVREKSLSQVFVF